jgi:RNA polymerase sigma factor (sigma-70 family)
MTEDEIKTLTGLTFKIIRRMKLYDKPDYDLEDLVQDALTSAFTKYHKFDEKQSTLVTFMYPRIQGAIIDSIRNHDFRPRTEHSGVPIDRVMTSLYNGTYELEYDVPIEVDYDGNAYIKELRNKLDHRDGMIFDMLMEDYSQVEIAETMNLSQSRICAMKRRLKKRLVA